MSGIVVEHRAAVLTVSDSVSAGTATDGSGPVAAEVLSGIGFTIVEMDVVPDGIESVATSLIRLAEIVDLVVTSGGTGLSPRDHTPEATRSVIDREVQGLSEAMRAATFGRVPFGMLSRGVAGMRGECLIVNLPGSQRAVEEGLAVIAPVLIHAVDIANGNFGDHR